MKEKHIKNLINLFREELSTKETLSYKRNGRRLIIDNCGLYKNIVSGNIFSKVIEKFEKQKDNPLVIWYIDFNNNELVIC